MNEHKISGFWAGMRAAHLKPAPQLRNPYPLRTTQHTDWGQGFMLGYKLGLEQQQAAQNFVQSMLNKEEPS